MPDPNLTLLKSVQKNVRTQQDKRDRLVNDLAATTAEIGVLNAEAAALAASGDVAAATAKRGKAAQLGARRAETSAGINTLDATIRESIDRLRASLDPCDADPNLPLLLLPVRIETRYTDDGAALRVRIMPDDIHIDQLDRGLTDAEQAAGKAYWTAVWRAPDDGVDAAWQTLVASVGKQRALWTAMALEPINLANRQADAAPAFPTVGARSKRAAVARLLPDHFTVMANQNGKRSQKTGATIGTDVIVGLFAGDGSEFTDVNGLKLLPGAEWIADYAAAEKLGLAITLPLATPGGGIDDLFVFGVRRGSDPQKSAAELEDLFTAHLCTKGLAFVPQGTASNNTESDRAAWSRRPDAHAPPRDTIEPDPDSNAAVLGRALGLEGGVLTALEHAGMREQALARATNVALWNPSWGTFLDRANASAGSAPTVTAQNRELARRFHRDFVRGRGPLPALRVGRQPYGVLPVSTPSRHWKPSANDTFETGLFGLLNKLRGKWMASTGDVPQVGKGAIDATLAELLGTSPVSLGLRVRTVLSANMALLATKVGGAAKADYDLEVLLDQLLIEDMLNMRFVHPAGSLSKDTRPLALPLVDNATDGAAITAIMAGESPQIGSVLQALVGLAWDQATREVKATAGDGRLHDVLINTTLLSQAMKDQILTYAARPEAVPPQQYFAAAATVSAALGSVAAPDIVELQPVEAYRTSYAQLALDSTTETVRSELGVLAAATWLGASGRLAELRAALTELATALSPEVLADERRIVVAETLDTASHRLDAWLTGLVERRRQALRTANPTGLTIGAYGWVQGIERAGPRANEGGYVAAPSLAHATTAGILRSAYLTHNPDASGSSAFAIDLSSERVRTALHLIDGVRQGQMLGALLGYRLERKIHEAGLDRLILSLRTISPLTQGKLTDRSDTVDEGAVEVLSAANVTDGLDLAEKFQGKVANWSAAKIRDALNATPKDNPYLTGPWPQLTQVEWTTVSAIIADAVEAADAVADLMMAESVHQLAQGNMARASAALDTTGTGDVPPPEPDIVRTRMEGLPYTHRIMLIGGGEGGWSVTRPRSAVAPDLEAWAGARLGPAADILVGNDAQGQPVSVGDSGLGALDIVYLAADRRDFERVLRMTLPALAVDAPFFDHPQAGWPAGKRAIGDTFQLAASLRALLMSCRPAAATDFGIPNTPSATAVTAAELGAVHDRLQAALSTLSLRSATLAAELSANPIVIETLSTALGALADFGILLPDLTGDAAVGAAHLVLAQANKRIAAAQEALETTATAETLSSAGQSLFGDGFWVTPRIGVAADTAWSAASGAGAAIPAPSRSAIRRYLTDFASVRDNVRRYVEVGLLGDATGAAPTLKAVQLAGPGDSPPRAWIGGTIDPAQPTATGPVLSIVVDASAPDSSAGELMALIVDEWNEVIPLRERRGAGPDDPVDARVTAGIALNANGPGARAPQALLLAVSPDGARWTSAAVIDLLTETLEMARMRAVTLEHTNGTARFLPALYERAWSLQGEKVLDLRFVAEKIYAKSAVAAYVKDKP